MKYINKLMMLTLLVMPFLFASCDKDDDSNPTLDLSHVAEGFVLNTPAYAGNTYDLAKSDGVQLTCTQPDYGDGVPYIVRYFVQVSIDPTFAEGNKEAQFTELSTSFTTAKMLANVREMNDALVDLYQAANPDADIPSSMPVYVRLRAIIDGSMIENLGETYSNVITLQSVRAEYQAPDVEYPACLYVVGSSIQNAWSSWKQVSAVYGLPGQYYTVVYVPDGGSFKWGTYESDWRGYSRITVDDKAGAGVSDNEDDNLVIAKGGWYTLHFEGTMSADKKSISYTLHIQPAEAYIMGAAAGDAWDEANAVWALQAPADQTGEWVSPAFAGSGELRAYIRVPGLEWWRTEFTLYKGNVFYRKDNIVDNWASNVGEEYSVNCSPGQKLYINFDKNTGEVK